MILAIDPGPTESAYVLYDAEEARPLEWAKVPNAEMRRYLDDSKAETLAIEAIASYGMSVGAEVFSTCIEVGRFVERWINSGVYTRPEPRLVYRKEVALHLCHSSRAKDANVRQALIDRYGGKERAIGRKKAPGPLYGIAGDCWSGLAVAVTAAETA